MEGAALAAKRQSERDVSLAWHTAAFTAAAKAGKLKKLDHYLKQPRRRPAQTPSDMLAVMREFQARGAKMTFKQVN